MKKLVLSALCVSAFLLSSCQPACNGNEVIISKEQLLDKIKGAWAGQTIGCTFGGPTEFKWTGQMIPDTVEIGWPDGRIAWYYDHVPGLYDDIYMDLTFVDVFERLGLDAPVDSFALAFANAGYPLWHANQSARYNILNGIMPPASGHWKNNPHANDIDYQIEADFAGIMAPGMPNAASAVSDKIGHIMNYGDGWYGGVFVGAMYTMAFVSDNLDSIIINGLKTIPEESHFYQCMSDVIEWHKQYPDDWTKAWQLCEDKWTHESGCPDGMFNAFNIDALVNSAYILIGLLYGEGDFYKTMDISTRCGQDSDCNPASAAGILGAMMGYSNIPEKWMKNLHEVEDRNFAYTNISLNDVYQMSMNQALQMVERNGGRIEGENVVIMRQLPEPVALEVSFKGTKPTERINLRKDLPDFKELAFTGNGFVLRGSASAQNTKYTAQIEIFLDGKSLKTVSLPTLSNHRSNDICWQFELPQGEHKVELKWLNPDKDAKVTVRDAIIYVED